MDQTSSFPSVQLKNDKTEITTQGASVNNNQQSANAGLIAEVPKRPPELNKPSKPAPKKPVPKHEDRVTKPVDISKKTALVPNQKSKSKSTKRDSGSVFYIDTSTDNGVDTEPLSAAANSNKTVQKTKQAAPHQNIKSKPSLTAPRKPKAKEKASEIDVVGNNKVEPPDKAASKPKLKPTIITAKTPKPQGRADEMKVSSPQNVNTPIVTKTMDDDRPSRPSFPPSTEKLNEHESQPERPKVPPNVIKEEQREVEKKREQKKGKKNEQPEKKRPKSKPLRPPMAKESTRLKPARPPPAKPSVTRCSTILIVNFLSSMLTQVDNIVSGNNKINVDCTDRNAQVAASLLQAV